MVKKLFHSSAVDFNLTKLAWTLPQLFVLSDFFGCWIKSKRLLLLLPCSCLGTVGLLITADWNSFVCRERVCCSHVVYTNGCKCSRGRLLMLLLWLHFFCSVFCGYALFFQETEPRLCFRYRQTFFFSNNGISVQVLLQITGQNKDQHFLLALGCVGGI